MSHLSWSPFVAIGAMGLALTVALLDRPVVQAAAPLPWADAVEAGADHITPTQLAERLLNDPNSVLLVDVRLPEEFANFHLPQAHNLSLPELLGSAGAKLLAANPGRTLVLCSQGMTHPAQAWVELTRRAVADVRILEDGLDGFVRDVLTPPSLRGGIVASQAGAEFERFRAARAHFLAPREPAAADADGAEPTPPVAAAPTVQAEPAQRTTGAARLVAEPARLATDPARLTQPTLVSTAWVARRGSELVLLDARQKPEDFAAGHLPGARHVPTKAWREERNGVPDELLLPDALARAVGALGIDADTEVVVYGDEKLQDATLLALGLIRLGHARLAILEGGLGAWRAEGRPLSTQSVPVEAKVYTSSREDGLATADLAAVIEASQGLGPALLDVRPADAYRGDVSTEARAGHIPGSLNRPYSADVVQAADGLFWRPLAQLRADYAALGLSPEAPVIVSCRTGHQASQTYFTLRYLLGYRDVRLYDGSWTEWAARPELPIATGDPRN